MNHAISRNSARLVAAAISIAIPLSAGAAGPCHVAPHSNVGCEFYAVTLPNAFLDQSAFPFAVRALNARAGVTAHLQISGGGLVGSQSHDVSSGTASDLQLPWVSALSNSQSTVLLAGAAYHLVADSPLSVWQFNSDSTGTPASPSASNDATLLMPVQTAGTSFRVATWPEFQIAGNDYPAQVAIIGTVNATSVQISAAGGIQAGAGLTATGGSAQLNAGDVLLVSSALTAAADFSGAQITSNSPVVVLTAHAGTFVPSTDGFGDHLEDALPPTSELGQDYMLVRPSDPSSGSAAKQMIKLVGTVDNTNVTYDPAVAGAPGMLSAGQSVVFEAGNDVHVHADQKFFAAQFMEGSQTFSGNTNNAGDPSQLTSIPSNRGALVVNFVAPTSFAPVFAQVIGPTGAGVQVDGVAVTAWNSIGSSGYSAANVSLCCTDFHSATSNQPITVSVYAYPASFGTSYWYAAGVGPSDDIFGDSFD